MTLEELQNRCEAFIAGTDAADAAHDLHHTRRVVRNAVQLTAEEKADPQITLPAAWLHDCVAVAKDSPHRAKGSLLAAEAATTFLAEMHYPEAAGAMTAEESATEANTPELTLASAVPIQNEPDPVSPFGFAVLASLVGMGFGIVIAPWLEKWNRRVNNEGKEDE